jgi:hypothetical protein
MIKPTKEPQRLSGLRNGQSLSFLVVSGELDTGLQMYIRQVLRNGYYQGSRPPLATLDAHESSLVS